MAYINYIKLYNYFINQEELTSAESFRNIWRTRNLPKEFKEAVYKITEGRLLEVKDFQVGGVTLVQLCKDEGMKKIQAVFFLDWLRREPANAHAFMASRRFRESLEIDGEFKSSIKAKLNKLQTEEHMEIATNLVPEDTSHEDIEVESDSEHVGCMTADSLTVDKSEE